MSKLISIRLPQDAFDKLEHLVKMPNSILLNRRMTTRATIIAKLIREEHLQKFK